MEPNTPIPGSKYFRSKCLRCRTPMRACTATWQGFCERCDPPTPKNRTLSLTPRQRTKIEDEDLQVISIARAIEEDID